MASRLTLKQNKLDFKVMNIKTEGIINRLSKMVYEMEDLMNIADSEAEKNILLEARNKIWLSVLDIKMQNKNKINEQ